MALIQSGEFQKPVGFPRIYGDGPSSTRPTGEELLVPPVYTGMALRFAHRHSRCAGFPRVHGDGPGDAPGRRKLVAEATVVPPLCGDAPVEMRS